MIGVFDSGVGGLSILKVAHQECLDDSYIYFGDTKNLPYGNKTKEQIIEYTTSIMRFLISKGATKAIIACNTTSALAYETLQEHFKDKIKIYPLIQTVAPYIAKTADIIGIMATQATVNTQTYTKEIKKANPAAEVYEQGCPGLTEIVENRLYEKKESLDLIYKNVKTLLDKGCKKIVLGCTHYPYLLPILTRFAPVETFINPSYSLIAAIKNEFKNAACSKENNTVYYVSKNPAAFIENAKVFYDIKGNVILEDSLMPITAS